MKRKYLLIFLIILVLSSFVIAKGVGPLKEKNKYVGSLSQKRLSINEISNSFEKGGVKVFIKFKENINLTNEVVKKYGIKNSFEGGSSAFVNKEVLNKLLNDSSVESVSLIGTKHILLQDSVSIVNASITWNLKEASVNLTGQGQTICIIDTGVDYTHPDLGGCYGNNDPSSSCKIIGGWDYCADNVNCITEDNDPMDVNGHGTHVSGIVSANGTIMGVAPSSKIVMVKSGNSTGSFWDDDLIKSIDWCVNNASKFNISVISMSLGGDAYDSYCDNDFNGDGVPFGDNFNYVGSINAAIAKNITVVIASGNDRYYNAISAPACIRNSTAVTSTNKTDDVISYFANTWNDSSLFILAAPGERIYSTYKGGLYATMSGTSMATPHVAGAIAILNQYLKPNLQSKTPQTLISVLNNTGKQIYGPYADRYFSRINIYNAIISLDADGPVVNLLGPANNNHTTSINQTFSCNASDLSLKNMTFYLWNTTSIVNSTSRNVSGAMDSYSVNLTNLPYTNYTWNCYYYDEHGNLGNSGNYSLFLDNFPPAINVNKPLNNSWNNGNFNISLNEEGNCSYSLNNSANISMNSSDNLTFIGTNTSLVQNSNYNVTFYCQDIVGNFNNTLILFRFDNLTPSVNITGQIPTDETSNNASKTFYYNVSDDLNITECELIVNNSILLGNQSQINNETNNFTNYFVPGTYNWGINCTDEAGNVGSSATESFTISAVVEERRSSGGGGGGGGGAPVVPTITENEIIAGVTKSLYKGNSIKFSLGNQNHSLALNNLTNSSANITIRSDPVNLILNIGQSTKINLTSRDYYDLSVKLENLSNGRANITLKEINESIVPLIDKKIMAEDPGERVIEKGDKLDVVKNKYVWAVAGAVLVLLIMSFFILNKRINNKK